MSNGFVTSRPGKRHGTVNDQGVGEGVAAGKFTVPGSGLQRITEIGHWMCKGASDPNIPVRMGILSHNSDINRPQQYNSGGLVANSETSEQSISNTSIAIKYWSYTDPVIVISGVSYWLAWHKDMSNGGSLFSDRKNTGGTRCWNYEDYPTWPSDWTTEYESTYDVGAYAVYQSYIPMREFQYHYNHMRP